MSWSVSIIGKPEAVVAELEKESERMSGQSKVEFDSAKPHLAGLVRENFKKPGSTAWLGEPFVHLEANGSGCSEGGEQTARQCSATVRSIAARLALVLLAAFALTLTGCQGLSQALGISPAATAPAYSGVGVVVVGSENTARLASRADLSGDTGADGSGSQSAEQSLEIPAEVVEALVEAAKDALAANNPVAAAGILGAIPASKPKDGAKAPAKKDPPVTTTTTTPPAENP